MRRVLSLLAVAAVAALAGCGSGEGSPSTGSDTATDARTVDIEMRDIAFSPTAVEVRAGEKVRFVFRNTGQVTHDAFIGDAASQDTHEKDMRAGHAHGKGQPAVSVKAGKSAQLTYTFARAGEVIIGCHQPGHYTGGMKAAVTVA